MSYYQIAKKWIECPDYITMLKYAGNTEEEWINFCNFIKIRYGCISDWYCLKYIQEIEDYIKDKI